METSLSLRALYTRESSRIRKAFDSTTDGATVASQRSALVDKIVIRLWEEVTAEDRAMQTGICLGARGGYGRGALLPHSDIDLLFLSEDPGLLNRSKDSIGLMCQHMWDLGLRVAPTVRTLSGCSEFDANNVELTLSLLECRYLAGDTRLFRELYDETVPRVVRRNWSALVETIVEVTRQRHAKYGNTVFHLEPNVKECPGGLRDFHVACLVAMLLSVEKGGSLPAEVSVRKEQQAAVAFLMSTRSFLHFLHGRDDNVLTWEAQDAAAARGIGLDGHPCDNTAEWTRNYFRHARPISRWVNQLLDEIAAARSSLYRQFLSWRSRVSNQDFSVVGGRVYLQESSAARDPELVLRMFEFIAHHGFKLAADTQSRIEQALPSLSFPAGTELWMHLRNVLLAPHAADALRDMHAVGILDTVIPEYRLIDSLIIRDFYHRYTVDEHSFAAIESLHRLKTAESDWDRRYAAILEAVEQPDLLFLAVLLHDIGKGLPDRSHVEGSIRISETTLGRLGLSSEQRETVLFLIANHLEMSAAMRRDIFDYENIRALAQKVGSSERLKMLCLLTYADIRAVNPNALSSWKAENLWHLYMGASNDLDRSADDDSLHTNLQRSCAAEVGALVPSRKNELCHFLADLPPRYLRAHSADQIATHFAMATRLGRHSVQVNLRNRNNLVDLTLVTRDRPSLFATLCGVLTAWSMDIVKANAFTGRAGIVVDTISFRDRFRTIELNPPEKARFERNLIDVISGDADASQAIESRIITGQVSPAKVTVETRCTFDNDSSSHSTLLEVVAQDRPGLLYCIASTLSAQGCNIDIALVDTEGQMAIDVFYITHQSAKLDANTRNSLRRALYHDLALRWDNTAPASQHAGLSPSRAH